MDLAAVLAPFVALRHEVNLQTKAVRAQQELNAQTLDRLAQALASLDRSLDSSLDRLAQGREEADTQQDEMVRPFLKTLIDVQDALSLAGREVQRLRANLPAMPILPSPTRSAPIALPADTPPPKVDLPHWARWLGWDKKIAKQLAQYHGWMAEQRQTLAVALAWLAEPDPRPRILQMIDGLLTGYTMGLERLERTAEQWGLEQIPAAGEPFDPETMEAVEVLREPGRNGSEVIEEVRRGYLWKGRVFRFAQVRVARGL